MDNTNSTTTKNENLIPKFKTPVIFYPIMGIVIFLVIMMFMILFDVNVTSFGNPSKS